MIIIIYRGELICTMALNRRYNRIILYLIVPIIVVVTVYFIMGIIFQIAFGGNTKSSSIIKKFENNKNLFEDVLNELSTEQHIEFIKNGEVLVAWH